MNKNLSQKVDRLRSQMGAIPRPWDNKTSTANPKLKEPSNKPREPTTSSHKALPKEAEVAKKAQSGMTQI